MSDLVATQPAPGPPRAVDLPGATERVLDNGLRVVAFRDAHVPLVTGQLLLPGGGAEERDDEAGLAAFTAALLSQGTETRSAVAFADAIDALGARFDASAGYDATIVAVGATTPAFAAAFDILGDVVRRPLFDPDEIERVRRKSLSDLDVTYSNPGALARLVAQRVAFGAAPYAHPLAGTRATLAALARERIAWYHTHTYRPDRAILVIGGDCTADEAFAHAARVFGDWKAPATPPAEPVPFTVPPPGGRVVIIDQRQAGRTAIVAGNVAIPRRSPQYPAATVATAVLSGYSGRLNQAVRVKRGLSYGAGASLLARRASGALFAATLVDHTRVAEATGVVLDELRGVAERPPDETELRTRKATVTGGFARAIETLDGIAGTLAEFALFGLPLDDLRQWLPSVEAVTAPQIAAFIEAVVEGAFVVLCGDASVFGDAVRAAYPHAETIAFEALDLGRADLGSLGLR